MITRVQMINSPLEKEVIRFFGEKVRYFAQQMTKYFYSVTSGLSNWARCLKHFNKQFPYFQIHVITTDKTDVK